MSSATTTSSLTRPDCPQTQQKFPSCLHAISIQSHQPNNSTDTSSETPPAGAEELTMGGLLSNTNELNAQETAEGEDDHLSNSGTSSSALSSCTALSPGPEGSIHRRRKNKNRSRGRRDTRNTVEDEASKLREPSRDTDHSEDAPQEGTISNVGLPSQDAQTTEVQQTSHSTEPTEALQSLSMDEPSQGTEAWRVAIPFKAPSPTSAPPVDEVSHRDSTSVTGSPKTSSKRKGKKKAKKPDLKSTDPAVGISQSGSSSLVGLSKVLSSNIAATPADDQKDVTAPSATRATLPVPPNIVVSKPEENCRRGSAKTSGMPKHHGPPKSRKKAATSLAAVPSSSGANRKQTPSLIAPVPSPSGSVMTSSTVEQYTPIPKGAFFWDLTTESFECAKAGCDKMCAQWDSQTCICPACGPLSKIRYCTKEHLRDSVREHWPVCGYFSFQHYAKKSSIQEEVMAGPPMIPSIYNSPSLERHRQAMWFSTASSEGDYFIFNDKAEQVKKRLPAGHPNVRCSGKFLMAVRWSSPAEKDKFRRCLAVCLLASRHVESMVDYVYRMIRDNLRSHALWSRELGEIVWEQLWLETEVEVETSDRHACPTEWTGFPPRHCQDPICIAERESLLGDFGLVQGFEHLCQFMEAQHWLLRANRTTHPSCQSIEGRILGEGYGDWVPVQDRHFFRRGEGWDGAGTGPMQYEGPHWR
ncbi:hypothetical protein N7486_010910 [Penicillium sp. IBT 16267x]|nr:hypothetical protein N7486_010910 [Penicillium sp. IBT 16267x]